MTGRQVQLKQNSTVATTSNMH